MKTTTSSIKPSKSASKAPAGKRAPTRRLSQRDATRLGKWLDANKSSLRDTIARDAVKMAIANAGLEDPEKLCEASIRSTAAAWELDLFTRNHPAGRANRDRIALLETRVEELEVKLLVLCDKLGETD